MGSFGQKSIQSCDPGRHLQECSGARAGECFLSAFGLGHLERSTPKSAFWHSWGGKKRRKALKKHSLSLWGTFRPGPLSTPVNGGRDLKSNLTSWHPQVSHSLGPLFSRKPNINYYQIILWISSLLKYRIWTFLLLYCPSDSLTKSKFTF